MEQLKDKAKFIHSCYGMNDYFKPFREHLQEELKNSLINAESFDELKEIQIKFKYLVELETTIINTLTQQEGI